MGKNGILKNKAGEQIFPATTADQVAWNDRMNLKQAISEKLGAPYAASTVSSMTDRTRIYIYTGDESGYTKGNWYYWNGSSWVSGGVYNSAAIQTDKTLTQSDKAADGEVVGQEIGQLKESLGNVNEEISGLKGVGSGLTTEQKRYIVSLFKSAVYSENMSDIVTALEDSFNTIPATGIKLSHTTIKFSGIGDTQKITSTLTPDTATSSILWESDNTDVATVKDGVVTAVNDGIATITATSGSATAKCSVNVNTKELYSISNKVCNADFYEATGLKFGSDSANGYSKSWTLFANFSTKASTSVGGTIGGDVNAFQFRTNGANSGPGTWCRNGFSATNYPEGDHANWCFVITHDAYSNIITVYEYIEEALKTKNVSSAYNAPNNSCYTGELYMGGETSATYVGTIYDFSIIMRQMTSEEITTLLKGGVY